MVSSATLLWIGWEEHPVIKHESWLSQDTAATTHIQAFRYDFIVRYFVNIPGLNQLLQFSEGQNAVLVVFGRWAAARGRLRRVQRQIASPGLVQRDGISLDPW